MAKNCVKFPKDKEKSKPKGKGMRGHRASNGDKRNKDEKW